MASHSAGNNSGEQRPLVGVGVALVRGGRVFLARRQRGHGAGAWASAGGHLEYGETLEQCARREALEELGVRPAALRILCVGNVIAYGRHYLDVEFLADIGDQEPRPRAADGELGEYGWFPLDAPPEPLFQPMRLALASLRSGQWYFPGPGADAHADADVNAGSVSFPAVGPAPHLRQR